MTRWTRYVKALVQIEEGMPWFFPVFGAILLSIFANLLYDLLKDHGGIGVAALLLLGIFLLAVLSIGIYTRRLEARRKENLQPIDKPHPSPHKGLVILVSNEPVVRKAIDYHLPILQHCWLITTPQTASLGATVQNAYLGRVNCYPRGIENELDSEGCYHLVSAIYAEAERMGLAAQDIIADITGGTKPMTAALVLACLRGEPPLDLQHVPTRYETVDGKRQPTAPLDPIQIVIRRNQGR